MTEERSLRSDVPADIAHWGRQTIFFAMSVHAIDVRKPLDDSKERARIAGVEAGRITQELWAEAHGECAEPVRIAPLTMLFARKVFAWAADHLGYSLPS